MLLTVLSKRAKRRKYRLRPWVYVALALIIISVILGVIFSPKSKKNNPIVEKYNEIVYTREYEDLVSKYSKEYNVDINLIYAVIKTESDFKPDAVSSVNAIGLMQMTKDTFDWVSMKLNLTGQHQFEDLKDPQLAIQYGTYLLSYLLDEFEGQREALSAYHAGRGIVNEWLSNEEYSKDGKTLDVIPYKDTNHYVNKVTTAYDAYCKNSENENKSKNNQTDTK